MKFKISHNVTDATGEEVDFIDLKLPVEKLLLDL